MIFFLCILQYALMDILGRSELQDGLQVTILNTCRVI